MKNKIFSFLKKSVAPLIMAIITDQIRNEDSIVRVSMREIMKQEIEKLNKK